jgi:protein-S-isoprenylcysteine O-methyltransferase Ste14
MNNLAAKRLSRLILILIAIFPLFYWRDFYDHFYAYLTGTIISNVITNQWSVVTLSIIFFALFLIPLNYRRRAKWLDYGLGAAFFVSLFIEMYGIPLTILFASKYFFSPGTVLPDNVINFNFFGVGMGMDLAMAYGSVLMAFGLALISIGWQSLYRQAKGGAFAHTGVYALSRHPQYLGFILLILGWLIGWPTIITAVFSPLLIFKYLRAAKAEERDALTLFGERYADYLKKTPFLA